MSKIIIHNHTDKADCDIIDLVSRVTRKGFISGKNQYCYLTVFKLHEGKSIEVLACDNRGGDTHTFKVNYADIS